MGSGRTVGTVKLSKINIYVNFTFIFFYENGGVDGLTG